MLQRLGQSFNSAGIALFARIATVGGLAGTLLRCTWHLQS
jgi:hypothetical protein